MQYLLLQLSCILTAIYFLKATLDIFPSTMLVAHSILWCLFVVSIVWCLWCLLCSLCPFIVVTVTLSSIFSPH